MNWIVGIALAIIYLIIGFFTLITFNALYYQISWIQSAADFANNSSNSPGYREYIGFEHNEFMWAFIFFWPIMWWIGILIGIAFLVKKFIILGQHFVKFIFQICGRKNLLR